MTPEQALWVAVVEAVLDDARKGRDVAYLRSRDFQTVLALAGFDPEAVLDRMPDLVT